MQFWYWPYALAQPPMKLPGLPMGALPHWMATEPFEVICEHGSAKFRASPA
jgi:hypothetical protein